MSDNVKVELEKSPETTVSFKTIKLMNFFLLEDYIYQKISNDIGYNWSDFNHETNVDFHPDTSVIPVKANIKISYLRDNG